MIVRVWRGKTSPAKADAYSSFLQACAHPDYGDVEGNRGWMLLERTLGESTEFIFLSFWDSMDAVARYTGGDPNRPKYYPEDRAALLEPADQVDHFQVVDLQSRW
jgi:heme-degrading monooxygenase HmoA